MRRLLFILVALFATCAQADDGASPDQEIRDARAAAIGAHGLRLSATFEGTLPCADCAGTVPP